MTATMDLLSPTEEKIIKTINIFTIHHDILLLYIPLNLLIQCAAIQWTPLNGGHTDILNYRGHSSPLNKVQNFLMFFTLLCTPNRVHFREVPL